ncbi:MAG: cysteine--tRNA ligase [Pseudomonadota bacterium]|nr:cysteine--tRNA ligase [Pseudomonadota bacterium]
MLRIFNSLSGEKEEFKPLRENEVRMYVCGITVYDHIHLGHARMLCVFDLVQRHLRAHGLRVTYVRNITDIDDKIIKRAAESGEEWHALAQRYTTALDEDCRTLGLQTPDAEPRATDYIPDIIAMIETLIAKNFAYVAADGDVLYSVRKFPHYGRLSGKRIDDLRSGSRVQIDEAKHDPLDFVLWKHSKPGEPCWKSPWGDGRPGWHIECSAMSTRLLGSHFDLHGGGLDLKFPHHENEIAQSCAAHGGPFVNLWMHNGFVRIDDEKMSKSTGNFLTVRDILKTLRDPEVLRLFLLSSHYRGPINYSRGQLTQADETLAGLYRSMDGVASAATTAAIVDELFARFTAALDDDFNTPEALAVMQATARNLNTAKTDGNPPQLQSLAATLRKMGQSLGLLQRSVTSFLQAGASQSALLADESIDQLIEDRQRARDARNFLEADRIRDALALAGVMLEDRAGGKTGWRRG